MDDFEKQTLVLKENINIWRKYFEKYPSFLTDTLSKSLQNSFAYSFVSENSRNFFYFEKKDSSGGGVDRPAKNASFSLTCSLRLHLNRWNVLPHLKCVVCKKICEDMHIINHDVVGFSLLINILCCFIWWTLCEVYFMWNKILKEDKLFP